MCRLLAYLGPPRALSDILLHHPHSLVEQAYAPREMVSGTVNADGFGVCWYPDGHDLPGTYHRATPIWSDPDLSRMARAVSSGRVFASVRNATPGFPVDLQSVAPFTSGPFLFMHNGAVQGFARRVRAALHERIPEPILATVLGPTDSETLFALTRTVLEGEEGGKTDEGDPAARLMAGLQHALQKVLEAAAPHGLQVSLNLGLTDGRAMVFSRLARGIRPNTLYHLQSDGALWVASEPLDPAGEWEPVPQDSWLLIRSGSEAEVRPIEDLPDEGAWA